MRRAIEAALRWAVFEHNDAALWTRVREQLGDLLTAQWRLGALVGTTAEQAFFVRCDETTMTAADIAGGQLIALVGLAFIKPTEFSILRIEQSTVN